MKRPLLDATAGELEDLDRGASATRVSAPTRCLRWVFQHRAERFEGMSDLPRACASNSTRSG